MNSSSVPAYASSPRSASRSIWRRRIWRGEATTGLWSGHARSASTSAVPSCHGTRISVSMSGFISKSP